MGLTRNQTAVLTVLARDERNREARDAQWVGRTVGSLANDVSKLMSTSVVYASLQSLESVGFVATSYKSGTATHNRLIRMVSITPDGMQALEQEHVLISELEQPSTAESDSATMAEV